MLKIMDVIFTKTCKTVQYSFWPPVIGHYKTVSFKVELMLFFPLFDNPTFWTCLKKTCSTKKCLSKGCLNYASTLHAIPWDTYPLWRYTSGKVKTITVPRTYTESTPDRRSVTLLRLVLGPDPADTHGAQDDARHTQTDFHHGEQEQTPQDFTAGAHPTAGISPAPTGGEQTAREESASPFLRRRSGFTASYPAGKRVLIRSRPESQEECWRWYQQTIWNWKR